MKNRPLFYMFAGVVLGEGIRCAGKVMAGAVAVACLLYVLYRCVYCGIFCAYREHFIERNSGKCSAKERYFRFLLAGMILGMLWWSFSAMTKLPENYEYGTIEGTVAEVGAGDTAFLRLKPFTVDGTAKEGAVLLYGDTEDVLPGMKVSVETKISPYEAPSNPGQFDLRNYYRCRGIYYSGFFTDYEITDGRYQGFLSGIYRLKVHFMSVICEKMNETDRGIMCAVLLGDKSYLDDTIKMQYQKNGVAHMLAISGLHISLIGGAIYSLLKRLGMGYPIAGALAFGVMVPYVLMIGSAVASVRAVIMLIILIGADMRGRSYDFLTSASVAGILLLFESPFYLTDSGFLLSFGAVMGIGLVLPAVKGFRGESLLSGMGIWLSLLPIQVWFFYEMNPCSILLNLIIVPMLPALLLFGFIGILTTFGFCFQICHLILWFYEQLMVFDGIAVGKPEPWQVILYLICLAAFCTVIRKRNWILSATVILAGVCVLCMPMPEGFETWFVDVGQGDCIVIQSPKGYHYMIDGGSTSISNVGQYRILPFLKYKGIQSLDYVLITHFDEDHYNGIAEMIESGYDIKHVIVYEDTDQEGEGYQKVSELCQQQQIPMIQFKRRDSLDDGAVRLECLFPEADYDAETNQQSLTMELTYQDFTCLLTGDLEKEGEQDFADMDPPDVDLLKVGHHGSKNASSTELLEQIKPEWAVISCGKNNRYGHPHEEALERLEEAGAQILVTKDVGAIWLEEKHGNIILKTYHK